MNIAIFSGSFNPIHMGHLILGNYVTEFTDIDEAWYLVTPQNPLKENLNLLDEATRLEMVNIALEAYPKLKASDFEFTLPLPSFTINTLEALSEKYPQHTFSLLIGADNWQVFDKWKDYKKLIQNYRMLIYPRPGYSSLSTKDKGDIKILTSPIIDVSSTFIRQSIFDKRDVKAFLPEKVYQFIKDKKLYI